ncbi:MaoC/PaaZ C-terminal domain-containing protein [Rhodococcus sp. NPDC127593]|uniref:MaoC/PaaZ C-terminal domain-containing protein n=1 Tax=Rhodococcus sp. NPDC127593 TaxID=3345404 RepID=UPI00363FFE97
MALFASVRDLEVAIGSDLGTGSWYSVEQSAIDQFAEATGDRQWIHVDTERAQQGPYGTTIAHGYLLLSLLPTLTSGFISFDRQPKFRLNYGQNRVRFVTPVKSGARIRAKATLRACDELI